MKAEPLKQYTEKLSGKKYATICFSFLCCRLHVAYKEIMFTAFGITRAILGVKETLYCKWDHPLDTMLKSWKYLVKEIAVY